MRSFSYLCYGIYHKIGTLQSSRKLFYRPILTCAFQPRSEICQRQIQQPHVVQFSSIGATLTSVWQNIRFTRRLKYSQHVLHKSSLRLYLCCAELPDYSQLMTELRLDDTYNCWCRLLYLHVWLVLVRLASEGEDGRFVYRQLVTHMWKDIDIKSKKLAYSAQRRDGIKSLFEHFQVALISYDEGALGGDSVLAGAIWRNIFEMNCADVSQLELMVDYVRRQLAHIDQQAASELLSTGLIRFLPLRNSLDAEQRSETVLTEIRRRV